jgi:cytochrome c-type biogenesis protein CcmH
MTDDVNSLRDQLVKLKSQHQSGKLDTKAYDKAKAKLERRLVDLVTAGAATTGSSAAAAAGDRAAERPVRAGMKLWLASGAVAVLVAAGGYWWTGAPGAIGPASAPTAAADGGGGHALSKEQIAVLAEKLAERLKSQPDDAEGWSMLGRSYMMLEKPAEAVAAYERVMKLLPDDANVVADYADSLAFRNGSNLDGEPTKLIERALKLDPNNLKALMLAGSAAFNRSDFAAAVKHWDRMAQVGPADHPLVRSAGQGAAEARQRGKLPPAAAAPGAAAAPAVAAAPKADAAPAALIGGGAVSGTVALSAELKAKVSPDDAVFIFARAAEGSRMPLAILRAQVKDLPFSFKLDDSMAMSPAATVSTAGRVVVGARISKSGQAMPQPGDLEGLSSPVDAGASGVQVTISKALP